MICYLFYPLKPQAKTEGLSVLSPHTLGIKYYLELGACAYSVIFYHSRKKLIICAD
jgi:hypothetical protein